MFAQTLGICSWPRTIALCDVNRHFVVCRTMCRFQQRSVEENCVQIFDHIAMNTTAVQQYVLHR